MLTIYLYQEHASPEIWKEWEMLMYQCYVVQAPVLIDGYTLLHQLGCLMPIHYEPFTWVPNQDL